MPYDAERSRLLRDLEAAFAPETFARAYPDAEPPMSVSVGGDSEEPAFEVIVWSLPRNVSNEHRTTTCPLITTTFDLVVGLVATGATERDATETLLAYVDCVHQACMADPTLGGLVDHMHPRLDEGGVGADGAFGYQTGANVRITCRRDIRPNKTIARAVRALGKEETCPSTQA